MQSRVEIGETHAVIYRENSSSPIVAAILFKRLNEKGLPAYVVLDRKIHQHHDKRIGEYFTFGILVTELSLRDDRFQ